MRPNRTFLLAAVAAAAGPAVAARARAATPFQDQLVQAPSLKAPERGSVAGALAALSFGPGELSRGAFGLPSPFAAPAERGPLLAQALPSYSPDRGLSEWGAGWSTQLVLRRQRPLGEVAFDDADGLVGPWGEMKRGDDGAWYPAGLRPALRMVEDAGGYRATLGDGTVYEFDAADAVVTPRGTYAWHLSRAVTAFGDRTELVYERNGSGRPFLARARYGGRGAERQYEIEFAYEQLAFAFDDYASGAPQSLDRRVAEVRVRALAGGAFEPLVTYRLGYAASATGPAFYLARVDKVYRSGAQDPPVLYAYDSAAEPIERATWSPLGALDAYLAQAGAGALQPNAATPLDVDDDGLVDLEHNVQNTLVRQTPAGFVFESLPPPTGAEDPLCRRTPSTLNAPRQLARLSPGPGEPRVLALSYALGADRTTVHVCDRAGLPLQAPAVAGDWRLGPTARLVDLNRDGRPDLLRYGPGAYRVAENVGQGETAAWAPQPDRALSPAVAADTVWAHDVNGDGVADLVARHGGALTVWHGRGGLQFGPEGTTLGFALADGTTLGSLAGYELTFVDANHDGLTDVLLSRPGAFHLMVNEGPRFRQAPAPALAAAPAGAAYPLALGLSGAGEDEVVVVASKRARSLALTRPSSGLLVGASDGKGTRVSFEYGRAAPSPGLRARPAVLAALKVDSSGYDPIAYAYGYEAPAMHSEARTLLGFGRVTKTGPLGLEATNFRHDDDLAGLVTGTEASDGVAPFVRFSSTTYEEASFRGVRVLRPASEAKGERAPGGAERAERTDFLAYERGVCPTHSIASRRQGALESTATLASVPGLDDALHCLPAAQSLVGTHQDPSLDFAYRAAFERDARGQITRLSALGPDGPLVQQETVYRPDGRVAAVSAPGAGASEATYDEATGLVAGVRSPLGVFEEAAERDPVTDAMLALRTRRGAVAATAFFRYDGLDRLAARFDDLGASSEAQPAESIAYAFADGDRPARVAARTLVAPGAYRDEVGFFTAAGDPVATAARTPEGHAIAGLTAHDRARGEQRSFARPPLPAGVDPAALTYADLLAGASELALSRRGGLGQALYARATVQAGAVREVASGQALVGGDLVASDVVNGAFSTRQGLDEGGRVAWSSDESGATTHFGYDALGRLTDVTLPDGARQRLRFDPYGRTAFVDRDGVGRVAYRYGAGPNPVAKDIFAPGGAPERSVAYARDGVGRVTLETHTLAGTGEARTFAYDYDGAVPGEPAVPGQVGLLTRVRGGGYERRERYGRDGSLAETVTSYAGWRTLRRTVNRYEDGSAKDETFVVTDGAGAELSRVRLDHELDAFGRDVALRVDGAEKVRTSYDAEGRTATALLDDGSTLTFHYDAATRSLSGYGLAGGPDGPRAFDWARDARGHVFAETVTTGAGQGFTNAYDYDPRGFLTHAVGAAPETAYEYDATGRLVAAQGPDGARSLARRAGRAEVAGVAYEYDALGRLRRKGDLTFGYGPDGQLARATRGADDWTFVYDDVGRRVMKLAHGAPVAAYADGAYLTEGGLVLPVRVGGQLAGVIEGGEFRPAFADPRGTLVGEGVGPEAATPYGVRAARPELSPAVDYVEKGFDQDLGLVRMGARDYDPALGEFTTPDPLFLEKPQQCLGSTKECNLYSYAKNDPLTNVDPTGLCSASSDKDPSVCIEAFIADEKIGFLRMGYGDDRTFSRNQNKEARYQIDVKIVRDGQGRPTMLADKWVGKSWVGWVGAGVGLRGSASLDVTHDRSDPAYTGVKITIEAGNGFRGAPLAPKGSIYQELNFIIDNKTLDVTLRDTHYTGYPTFGVYAYRPGGGTTTLFERAEGDIDELLDRPEHNGLPGMWAPFRGSTSEYNRRYLREAKGYEYDQLYYTTFDSGGMPTQTSQPLITVK